MNSFVQRCIAPGCQAEYKLDEWMYVCARCGGLLEVERTDNGGVRSGIFAQPLATDD